MGAGDRLVGRQQLRSFPPEVDANSTGRRAARSERRAGAVAEARPGDRLRDADRTEAATRAGAGADIRVHASRPRGHHRDDARARRADRRQAAADAAAAAHRTAARRGSARRVAGTAAAEDAAGLRARSRARCARSTPAAATASFTICSSWPAAPMCSATSSEQSVQMSTEMILARTPEVIIELHYGDSLKPPRSTPNGGSGMRCRRCRPSGTIASICLTGDEFVVPGPRIVVAAERFARTLHPEAF